MPMGEFPFGCTYRKGGLAEVSWLQRANIAAFDAVISRLPGGALELVHPLIAAMRRHGRSLEQEALWLSDLWAHE